MSTVTGTTQTPAAVAERAAAPPANPGGKLGKDEFLKLLVAQMRHQDPLNPMDGQQMAAQLAQFSSVEQLLNIGQTLEAQKDAQASLATLVAGSSALAAVGKQALASSDAFEVTAAGRLPDAVVAQLPSGARSATLVLYDANGQTVKTRSLGEVAAGRRTFDLASFGEGVGAGVYRLAVETDDGSGAITGAPASFAGRVDGVRYTPTGPVVTIGGVAVPFAGVTEVGG